MPSDPVWLWRRRRLRVRLAWLGLLLFLAGVLITVGRALPEREARGVTVDLGPPTGPVHRIFGVPSSPSEGSAEPTADTALGDLDLDLNAPLDHLRQRGAWCGPSAPEVRVSEALSEAAARQAMWLAKSGARKHQTPRSPHGPTPQVRARRSGYTGAVGEVIAWGQRTGEAVMDGWEGSPDHCHVVLDARWREVGWAYHEPVWVMLLGQPEPE